MGLKGGVLTWTQDVAHRWSGTSGIFVFIFFSFSLFSYFEHQSDVVTNCCSGTSRLSHLETFAFAVCFKRRGRVGPFRGGLQITVADFAEFDGKLMLPSTTSAELCQVRFEIIYAMKLESL